MLPTGALAGLWCETINLPVNRRKRLLFEILSCLDIDGSLLVLNLREIRRCMHVAI